MSCHVTIIVIHHLYNCTLLWEFVWIERFFYFRKKDITFFNELFRIHVKQSIITSATTPRQMR